MNSTVSFWATVRRVRPLLPVWMPRPPAGPTNRPAPTARFDPAVAANASGDPPRHPEVDGRRRRAFLAGHVEADRRERERHACPLLPAGLEALGAALARWQALQQPDIVANQALPELGSALDAVTHLDALRLAVGEGRRRLAHEIECARRAFRCPPGELALDVGRGLDVVALDVAAPADPRSWRPNRRRPRAWRRCATSAPDAALLAEQQCPRASRSSRPCRCCGRACPRRRAAFRTSRRCPSRSTPSSHPRRSRTR